MADSDGEYLDSDDEIRKVPGRSGQLRRGSGLVAAADPRSGKRAAWEDIQRSWDEVVEGADGSINSTVEGLREAGKRKR